MWGDSMSKTPKEKVGNRADRRGFLTAALSAPVAGCFPLTVAATRVYAPDSAGMDTKALSKANFLRLDDGSILLAAPRDELLGKAPIFSGDKSAGTDYYRKVADPITLEAIGEAIIEAAKTAVVERLVDGVFGAVLGRVKEDTAELIRELFEEYVLRLRAIIREELARARFEEALASYRGLLSSFADYARDPKSRLADLPIIRTTTSQVVERFEVLGLAGLSGFSLASAFKLVVNMETFRLAPSQGNWETCRAIARAFADTVGVRTKDLENHTQMRFGAVESTRISERYWGTIGGARGEEVERNCATGNQFSYQFDGQRINAARYFEWIDETHCRSTRNTHGSIDDAKRAAEERRQRHVESVRSDQVKAIIMPAWAVAERALAYTAEEQAP